jgi:hypothetical protein
VQQCRSGGEITSARDRDQVRDVDDDLLGVAAGLAAVRDDPVPDEGGIGAESDGADGARDAAAWHVRRSEGEVLPPVAAPQHRVEEQHVGHRDVDQYLAGAGRRVVHLADIEDLGSAELRHHHSSHVQQGAT